MNPPPVLSRISSNAEVARLLDMLDCQCTEEVWADALEAEDDFGFDLTGPNKVMRFATQGCGSIFGLLDSGAVVHIGSEGTAARVAPSLEEFWQLLVSLNQYLNDAVGSVGSSAIGGPEPDAAAIQARMEEMTRNIANWRADDDFPAESKQALASFFGSEILSDAEALRRLSTCDHTEPKFRPPVADD